MKGTILYVGAFELLQDNAAAQRAKANARIFSLLGYRTVCVGVSADVADGRLARLNLDVDAPDQFWSRSLPQNGAAWFRRIASVADLEPLFAAHSNDLKFVIGYDFPALALRKLASLARLHGASAIGESTEWYANNPPSSVSNVARNVDKSMRMRFQNSRLDGLIVASGFLKSYYQSRGVPVLELPTLMPDVLSPDVRTFKKPVDEERRHKRLIFAGSGFDPALIGTDRERLKDRLDHVIEALAAAAAEGADFVLDVFGVEREVYLAIVPEHAELIARLRNKLVFHGRQPRTEVICALEKADFSIFLRKETRVTLAGFPTKYSESIHHGTPVITNDAGSLSRYHQEGKTGHFIAYGDAQQAGQQLNAILAQTHVSVALMAEFCEKSGLFSPAYYVDAVEQFLTEVGQRHHALPL